MSEVVVTGSRGKPRTVASSAAPIDVVGQAQIAQTGKTTLKEALAVLLPSFNFGTVNGFAHNNVVRPVSMRGLSSAYTLVLVNGKRRHATSLLLNSTLDTSGATPVDIDQIPLSAVDHVEVLRDGAAAQYGSDAIAGVINIILKSADHGGSATVTAGKTYDGDGGRLQASADWGLSLPHGGSLHLAIDAKTIQRTDRNDDATGTFYYPLPDGSPDPREATIPKRADYNGDPKLRSVAISQNLQIPVGRVTLYSFGTLGLRQGDARQTKRRPKANNDIIEIYPDGYIPLYKLHEADGDLTIGARGELAGWSWDASTAFGVNRTSSRADTLNPSLGPTGPTNFYLYGLRNRAWTSNLDVVRPFEVGLSKPLNLAFGAEVLNEKYTVKAGEPASYEDGGYSFTSGPLAGTPALIGVQGVNVVDGDDAGHLSRTNYAAYVDLGFNPIERWTVDLAGRGEHYDDSSGDTFSGKVSSRFELTKAFAVRGTASTGFRAPSLSQILYGQRRYTTQVVNGELLQFPSKIVRVGSPLAEALGAQPLKPEKSVNYSLGATYEPARNFSVTLDAYQVRIKDRIALTSTLSGPGVNALLAAAGLPSDIYVQYFANAIDTRTRGVDLVGDYKLNLDRYGRLDLSLGFNWNKTRITHIKDNPPELASLGSGLQLFDRVQQGSLTVGYPHTKLILSGDWTIGRFDVNLRETRYGGVTQVAAVATDDRSFGPKWITDLDVSYAITPQASIAIGAENLLDVYPGKNGIVSANGSGKYGTFSPFGMTGGYYYTRLSYRF